MTPGPHPKLGYAEALLAAVLWGSSGIFSVYLFGMGVPPQSLALLRPALGIAFLAALLLSLRSPGALRVSPRGLLVLGVGGGSVIGVFQLAYQMSIDAVGVPSTVALVYVAPAVVVASSGPLLGEWPTLRRVVLAGVTLLGVWMTVLGAEEVTPAFGGAGVLWGALAGLAYAGYTLFGRFATPRFGSSATVIYTGLGSCAWLSAVLPMVTEGVVLPPSGAAWGLLAAFALLTVAGAQFLFFDALGRIEAGRAAITTAAEPVVAALLATVLLSQGLSPVGWLGVGLVVVGVVGVGMDRTARGRANVPGDPPLRR